MESKTSRTAIILAAIGAAYFIGIGVALFVFRYVGYEHPLYLWDWGGFFNLYRDFMPNFLRGAPSSVADLLTSIRERDYNLSSIVPLAPFYAFMGSQRTGFILGIAAVYMVPAIILTAALGFVSIYRPSQRRNDLKLPPALFIACAAAVTLPFPAFWGATLRGLPDVVGLIPLGLLSLMLFRSRPFEHRPILTGALVGALLWMPFLFRRWYAYACVALVCVSVVNYAIEYWRASGAADRWKIFIEALVGYLVAGGLTILLLMLFQHSLVFRILSTSYSDQYVAYQRPIVDQLWYLYNTAGPVFTVLAAVGTVIALWKGNRVILMSACSAILTFVLFSRTQAPGIQHVLPMFLWAVPAILYSISWVLHLTGPIGRTSTLALLLLYSAVNFGAVFLPSVKPALGEAQSLFSRISVYPLRTENFSEYRRLIDDLKHLPGGDSFAVFASGSELSDSLLLAIDRSLTSRLIYVAHNDSRDGFRLDPVKARYAVVSDPIVTHLSPQHVIEVPARQILTGLGIGENYQLIRGPYALSNGHQAYIYERVAPYSQSDALDLERALQEFYPDWAWDGGDRIE